MTQYTDRFLSADSATQVSYRVWEPDGDVRAVVQLSHGMMEYVGRYAAYAEHLCSLGFAVGGNDHLGHGDTSPAPEDRGFFADTDGYRLLVEDLHTVTGILKERYPGRPVFLLGHSMGSFVARLYLSSYAEDIDGAVIMGTAGPGQPLGLALFLTNLCALFRGEKHRSKLIHGLAFGSYNKKIPKPRDSFAWLTKDETILARHREDPDVNFMFTLSGFRDLFTMLSEINCEEWAKTVPTDLPLLLISGGADPVGDYGKGVRKVAGLLAGQGARRLTVRFFADDRHEVLNETDRDAVYAYLDGWMQTVLEEMADAASPAD